MTLFLDLIHGHINIVINKTAFQCIWWVITIEWTLLAHFWKCTQYTPGNQIDTRKGASNVVRRLVVGRDWPLQSKRLPSSHNGCRLTTGSSAYVQPAKRQLCQRRLPFCILTYFSSFFKLAAYLSLDIPIVCIKELDATLLVFIVHLQYL